MARRGLIRREGNTVPNTLSGKPPSPINPMTDWFSHVPAMPDFAAVPTRTARPSRPTTQLVGTSHPGSNRRPVRDRGFYRASGAATGWMGAVAPHRYAWGGKTFLRTTQRLRGSKKKSRHVGHFPAISRKLGYKNRRVASLDGNRSTPQEFLTDIRIRKPIRPKKGCTGSDPQGRSSTRIFVGPGQLEKK